MKISIIISTLLMMIASCSSAQNNADQQKTKGKDYFVLPLKEKSLICTIEGDQIKEWAYFPHLLNTQKLGTQGTYIQSKSVVVNNQWICSIDTAISIYDLKGKLQKTIQLDFRPLSIHSKDLVAYIGGGFKKEQTNKILALIDFSKENIQAEIKEVPEEGKWKKSIDDILIVGNDLILIDNVIFPKFVFTYDISVAHQPKFKKTENLRQSSRYQTIHKGDANHDYRVMLTASSNRRAYTVTDYIIVEGKAEGQLSTTWHNNTMQPNNTIGNRSNTRFNDICLIGDQLYILKNNELHSLDLKEEVNIRKLKKVDTKMKEIKRLIRSPNQELIAVGDEEYEWIKR